ncbi:hypothetical protein [Lentzea jiangxiensis]|uniref:hypothetical protein n=1 Tax=Lentzea jiangxiensis TaxID=641025 RepID=UPI001C409FCA|nr:hypothetical protein [Lentzea jiangxiensis]
MLEVAHRGPTPRPRGRAGVAGFHRADRSRRRADGANAGLVVLDRALGEGACFRLGLPSSDQV